jgi:hypothetical protein
MSFRERDNEPVGLTEMFKTYFYLSEKCYLVSCVRLFRIRGEPRMKCGFHALCHNLMS